MRKEQLLKIFLEEHPEFNRYSPSRIEREVKRAERRLVKIEQLTQIAQMRFQFDLNVKYIAKALGISKQMVHKKIDRYLR